MMNCRGAKAFLSLGLLLSGSALSAETLTGATLSVVGAYDTDPYLTTNTPNGAETGAASIKATASPHITWRAPTTSFTLRGVLDHSNYTRVYEDVTNWQAGAELTHQLSARTSLDVSGSVSDRRNVQFSFDDTGLPTPPTSGDVEDVGYRVRTYNGSASLSNQFSARDSVQLQVFGGASRYPTLNGANPPSDNDYIGVAATYSRALSGTTSVTGGVNYSRNSFSASRFDESNVIRPFVGVTLKLNPTLELSADVGVDFSKLKSVAGDVNNSSLYGNASICRSGPRSSLCARASRAVQASAYAGTSTSTSVSASYSYRLTSRSTLSLAGSYGETQQLLDGQSNYSSVTTSANYRHRITERLSGIVSAQYIDRIDSVRQTGTDIMGSLGLSYQLGR